MILSPPLPPKNDKISSAFSYNFISALTGTAGGRIVTWKSVSQERLDSKTLKAEHPALYKKYANKSSYRRFTIKAAS